MSEFAHEPIRGLPGLLPAGEAIVWQGSPNWPALAVTAFHVRKVAIYFALIALWGAVAGGTAKGAAITLVVGAIAVGLLMLLSWLVARSTVYTLTNKRLVLRYGVALTKCVNLPLKFVATAGFRRNRDGSGDLPLELTEKSPLGYLMLWPHARPWRLGQPQPMLRAVPDADSVATTLGRTLAEAVPCGRRMAIGSGVAETFPVGSAAAA
jgi:hypothetical protein